MKWRISTGLSTGCSHDYTASQWTCGRPPRGSGTSSPNSLRTIFNEALEIDDPQQRAEYLARVCGADALLRKRLEELFEAHRAAGGFLRTRDDVAPDGLTAAALPLVEAPGTVIGRYKLLQQIGEGGCDLRCPARADGAPVWVPGGSHSQHRPLQAGGQGPARESGPDLPRQISHFETAQAGDRPA